MIKTANEQGQKVFINVCGSAKLPLLGGWAKGQVPPEVRLVQPSLRLVGQAKGPAPAGCCRHPLAC